MPDTAWFLLLWAAVAFIVFLVLAACQSRDANTYHITAYSGGTVNVAPDGSTTQDRGRQSTDVAREAEVGITEGL